MRTTPGAGALAEDNVAGPASAGGEGEQYTGDADLAAGLAQRQQQGQAGDGEDDPGEIQRLARSGEGYRQRSGEFERHGDAERNGLQRGVEEQVHRAHDGAIGQHRAPLPAVELLPPGLEDGEQHNRRQGQAKRGGAGGADGREQALGKGGAGLCKDHAERDEGDGKDDGLRPHGRGFRGEAAGLAAFDDAVH